MKGIQQQQRELTQSSENAYRQSLTIAELLRISAENSAFLEMLHAGLERQLFDDREIMEIGVVPLGISLLSCYQNKQEIKGLMKI
jgi:hypothetical protein